MASILLFGNLRLNASKMAQKGENVCYESVLDLGLASIFCISILELAQKKYKSVHSNKKF
jgi:hypothetical protein